MNRTSFYADSLKLKNALFKKIRSGLKSDLKTQIPRKQGGIQSKGIVIVLVNFLFIFLFFVKTLSTRK